MRFREAEPPDESGYGRISPKANSRSTGVRLEAKPRYRKPSGAPSIAKKALGVQVSADPRRPRPARIVPKGESAVCSSLRRFSSSPFCRSLS
jgi:hypothetical protein